MCRDDPTETHGGAHQCGPERLVTAEGGGDGPMEGHGPSSDIVSIPSENQQMPLMSTDSVLTSTDKVHAILSSLRF